MRTEFITPSPPRRHAYNAPDLSPIEFLQAVYNDSSLPMSIRIEAARGVLPYTEPRPASIPPFHIGCTIVIPPFEPRTPDPGSGTPSPEQDNTISQSFSEIADNTCQPSSGAPGSSNMMTTPEPSPFATLSPDEILHLKAIAHRHGLPEPHLCSYCGFWQTKTYPDCICGDLTFRDLSRDPSKMN